MKRVGLFFGSFNPVHNGHMEVAHYFLEKSQVESVWFVLSPHNPLKAKDDLLPNEIRLELLKQALSENEFYSVCQIEFERAAPHYTNETLEALEEKYPNFSFSLLLGADNVAQFDRWKNHQKLVDTYPIYVYPRKNYSIKESYYSHKNIIHLEAPLLSYSATTIRELLDSGKNASHLMPKKSWELIQANNWFIKH